MTEEKQETKKQEMPDNVVFIGLKPFMNYINAVQTQFQIDVLPSLDLFHVHLQSCTCCQSCTYIFLNLYIAG